MPKLPTRFRFRQFSLRTGAILFLAVGIGFGLAGRWIHDVRQRGEEQLRFVKRCAIPRRQSPMFGHWAYLHETDVDRFTALVRSWVHPEYNRKFTSIHASSLLLEMEPPIDLSRFFGAKQVQIPFPTSNVATVLNAFAVPEVKHIFASYVVKENVGQRADWTMVSKANLLESLELESDDACVELLTELGKLPNLKKLTVSGCRPEGIAFLAKAPSLEDLSFSLRFQGGPREPLSAAELASVQRALKQAFDELANRPQLVSLKISGRCPLTPNGLAEFCANSPLKELTLKNVRLTPECLAELAKLDGLLKLEIEDQSLEDAHLQQLTTAKKLKSLLVGPNISGDGIIKLREKLPRCEILRK